jgi:predicted membrane channel-forming protein YqfA (hemolysin III family)
MTERNTIQVPKTTNWKILSFFIAFGLIGLGVTTFTHDLNVYQQFYLRIFIGLSAAGIAAIIPGFFEINIKWLENTIKAGGAITVFLLVYQINPPILKDFKTFEGISGKWFYDLHPTSDALGFNSRHYGGTLYFNPVEDEYGKNLTMNGTVEWRYDERDSLFF